LSYLFNDHEASAWLWVIIDAINCLHGFLVFCVLIWWRKKIKKALADRQILCFICPSKWADIDDEEEMCLENEGNDAPIFNLKK
jgi:G protein-coupled receptor Mth (Methuselah protein)